MRRAPAGVPAAVVLAHGIRGWRSGDAASEVNRDTCRHGWYVEFERCRYGCIETTGGKVVGDAPRR